MKSHDLNLASCHANGELAYRDLKRNFYARQERYSQAADPNAFDIHSKETMQTEEALSGQVFSTDPDGCEGHSQMETWKENETPVNLDLVDMQHFQGRPKKAQLRQGSSSPNRLLQSKVCHVPQKVTIMTTKRQAHHKPAPRNRSTSKKKRSTSRTGKSQEKHSSNSEVYVWGLDVSGQLGLKAQKQFYTKPKQCSWNISVSQVACGRDHTAILTEQGQVYTLGSNQNGKLGQGDAASPHVKPPALVDDLLHCFVTQVSCGREHTVAVNRQGQVYSWGLNTQGALGLGSTVPATDRPQLVDKLLDVTQASCGSHFTLFLNSDGEVKACGNNHFGQLGINKSNQNNLWFKPTAVNINEKIGQIAAGDTHTLYLTQDGRVYASGDNQSCQLARPVDQCKFIHEPILVENLCDIQSVSCDIYSVALTRSRGDLYLWGRGDFGEYPQPTRVSSIPVSVQSCSVSESHISAVDAHGMVWVWGSNKKGELGLGDYTTRNAPFPLVGLQDKKITNVHIGYQFSFAYTTSVDRHDLESFDQPSRTPQAFSMTSHANSQASSQPVKIHKQAKSATHASTSMTSRTPSRSRSRSRSQSRTKAQVKNKHHISSAYLTQKSQKTLRSDASQKSLKKIRRLSRKGSKQRSLTPASAYADSKASLPTLDQCTPQEVSIQHRDLYEEPHMDIIDQQSQSAIIQSQISQEQTATVSNRDNQEHHVSQLFIDQLVDGEESKIKESAMQSDIQKLIKAVVAQRKYIESLEKDKSEQAKLVVALQNEQQQHVTVKKELEAYKQEKLAFLGKKDQMQEQASDIEKLRHEIDHLAEYLKDAQTKVERQNQTIVEYEVRDSEHQELVMRLGLQIEKQNEQIANLRTTFSDKGPGQKNDLLIQLDQAKMLLEQADLQRDKCEARIEELQQQVLDQNNQNSMGGLTNHALQRQIVQLEQLLRCQESMNDEKKNNIEILDRDLKQQAALAANREEILQKKIEEQFVQIRHEQAEKQALQFEVKKMRALVEEKDVVLRQEQNTAQILAMENEAMLKQCSQERDNMHKLKAMRVYSNIQPHHVAKVIDDATDYMKGGATERGRELDRALAEQKSHFFSHTRAASFDRTQANRFRSEPQILSPKTTAASGQKASSSPADAHLSYSEMLKHNIKKKIYDRNRVPADYREYESPKRVARSTEHPSAAEVLRTNSKSPIGKSRQTHRPYYRQSPTRASAAAAQPNLVNERGNVGQPQPASQETGDYNDGDTWQARNVHKIQRTQSFYTGSQQTQSQCLQMGPFQSQMSDPPTIHDAGIGQFRDGYYFAPDYVARQDDLQQHQQLNPLPNDNCRNAVNVSFVNTSGMQTTNLDKSLDYRHSQMLMTESSHAGSTASPVKTKVVQDDGDYPTEQIRRTYLQTSSQMEHRSTTPPAGGRPTSPTANVKAHHDAINVVENFGEQPTGANTPKTPSDYLVDAKVPLKNTAANMLMDATKREECGLGPREPKHSLSHSSVGQQKSTGGLRPGGASSDNITELATTYKQFSGLLSRQDSRGNLSRSSSRPGIGRRSTGVIQQATAAQPAASRR